MWGMGCNDCLPPFGCPPDDTCDPDAERGYVIKRPWNRGDTIILKFQLQEPYSKRVPNLSDMGSKVWFTVKTYLTEQDSTALFQGTLLSGDVVDLGGGQIQVTIPAAVTSIAAEGVTKFYYDLQIKWSGIVWTPEKGLFQVSPDVTRATT
jgi:hypothetical protein